MRRGASQCCRRELFERLDKPALGPLPSQPYVYHEWRKAKVAIDYHVFVDGHFYSVPYQLVGEQVDVALGAAIVGVYFRNRRVASHLRSFIKGGFTTDPAHRPKSHQAHLDWTPSRIINWAATVGPNTAALVQRIMETRPHPEMGYRSCLGIIRLGQAYPVERMEAAALRALHARVTSYKSLKSILEHGLDRIPVAHTDTPQPPAEHDNLRGRDYYH